MGLGSYTDFRHDLMVDQSLSTCITVKKKILSFKELGISKLLSFIYARTLNF